MSLFEKLKGMDQKFSWSFFGVLISVGFGIIGIYTAFLYEKKPGLIIQNLGMAPVYSLKENVNKLDILFEGEDIRKNNQTLTLLTLRVCNVGNSDILPSSFDSNFLPQFAISDCKNIKTEIINASNDYLRSTAKIIPSGDSSFQISPIIIEPNEFFDVKFLLLHNAAETPAITVRGKVAGMQQIKMLNISQEKKTLGFWDHTLGGNLLIQLVRILAYFIGSAITLIALFSFYSKAKNWTEKNRRKGLVRRFKMGSGLNFSSVDDRIFEEYINRGEMFIWRLSQFLSNDTQISQKHVIYNRYSNADQNTRPDEDEIYAFSDFDIIRFLIEIGAIQEIGDESVTEKSIKTNVNQFVSSLSILSPKLMREARRVRKLYGSESAPSDDTEELTEASEINTQPS